MRRFRSNAFRLLESFLNAFSRPFTAGNKRSTRFAVCGVVAVALVVCCWATLFRIPQKFVFMADSLTFKDVQNITIGENSDVNFVGVPHDYITVTPHSGGGATWQVARQHRDTLQYFKINGVNPNAHEVRNDSAQHINIRFPIVDSNGDSYNLSISITGEMVWNEWRNFSKQSDVLASHLATRLLLNADSVMPADSALYMRQILDNQHVRSFFHCEHGLLNSIDKIKLVILDTATTLDSLGYAYSGQVEGDECKVQFYNVTSYCYSDGKPNDYFQIADVNYVMKPLVRLTEWGAGHIMLRMHDGGSTDVCFPKGVGYVGTVDSLRQYAETSSNIITFRQSRQSYPSNSDIFLPYFSRNVTEDLFNLEFARDGSGLTVRDSYNGISAVSNPSSLLQFVPALRQIDLKSGRTVVHSRVGYIDKPFMLRYIELPLIVLLVLLTLTLGPWSPLRNDECRTLYGREEIARLPSHVAVLSFVAFLYCICKSMIALKLSYTFPYFEKLTVITPFNCAMMLLVFFTLLLVLNSRVTTYRPAASRGLSRWMVWGVLLAVGCGLCFTLFGLSDRQIAGGTIASYFPNEIGFTYKWWAENAYGTLDNHRTVSYALISVEALLLAILAVLYAFGLEWVDKCSATITASLNRMISASVRSRCNAVWDAAIAGVPLPMLARFTVRVPARSRWRATLAVYWNKVVGHVPAVLVFLILTLFAYKLHASSILVYGLMFFAALVFFFDFIHGAFLAALRDLFPLHFFVLAVLLVLGSLLGNFATAFITLIVILGLPDALNRVRFTAPSRMKSGDLPRHAVVCEQIIISLFYMVAAMVGDNGYMTNYLGFLMTVVCFYFIRLRPDDYAPDTFVANQNERKWTRWVLLAVVALTFCVPKICSLMSNPEEVDLARPTRRVMQYSDFERLQKLGYRYVESDSEFMIIMNHNMQVSEGGDPLSNDAHFLHPSISTGQSPVVLNDLSMPAAFFGAYGFWPMATVYFLLLFALLKLVLGYTFGNLPSTPYVYLTRPMQWRLLALMMWVGTSFYIFASYLGVLPFTGRLNPGYGVDAVGEALETAVLLAFMGAASIRNPNPNN